MRELYRADLERLGRDLTEIARLVHRAMMDAQAALEAADVHGAERVISEDARIDQLQESLDEQAVRILALQAPVATDLRTVVATLRMSSSLERMGDLCAHVALVARRSHPELGVPEQHRAQIQKMSDLAAAALRDAAVVITDRDLALAAQVEKNDDELDDLQQQIAREIGKGQDYTNTQIVDLTLLIRFYERLGDHAVSLVRRVGFLVTGDAVDTLHQATDVPEF